MSDTNSRIESALAERDCEALIGLFEDNFFDAKGANPYDFSQPKAQYEFAKDVSAFANAEGGWIIVGLKTRKLAAERIEVVESLDLMRETSFTSTELTGRVKAFVYPEIVGLDIRWIENRETPGEGVGVLHVPPQNADRKPFLIARIIDDGVPVKEIVFGYAVRTGDSSTPYSLQRLHAELRKGMSATGQRLTQIEEKVDLLIERSGKPTEAPVAATPQFDEELLRRRIDDVEGA